MQLIRLFDSHYHLFEAKGLQARHGSADIDISSLFPYVAAEQYVQDNGSIGLLITQTLFQSTAAAGFRKFRLPSGQTLGVFKVEDLVALQPFDGATNKTAIIFIKLGTETSFPVSCTVWSWQGARPSNVLDMQLPEVEAMTGRLDNECVPVTASESTSPWLISSGNVGTVLKKVVGESSYHPHKGCDTSGANAIYWVEVVRKIQGDQLLIQNLGDVGRVHKFDVIQHPVESKYVFPLLRGRDVTSWEAKPSCYILCAQSNADYSHAISERELKRIAPQLYSYFNLKPFRSRLEVRAGYVKYLQPQGEPFYALYDIKDYTMSKSKVVIREQSSAITAAVIGDVDGKVIIPDHKLSLITTSSMDEANFLCAIINSSPVRLLVKCFGISTQISVSTLNRLRLPRYDQRNASHRLLSNLARKCSRAASVNDKAQLTDLENEIDEAVAKVINISKTELKKMQIGTKND